MKILELCLYSAGTDGVFTRVLQESKMLSKKHEVRIFSSNHVKGSDVIAKPTEKINGIKVQRFPAKKLGGESFMKWDFERASMQYKPDIIIAHSYRQIHTTRALNIAKKLGAKVFLVTHAPFIQGNKTRSLFGGLAVGLYDIFVGPSTLPRFDKILIITKWETPILMKLGARKEQIVYVPNGIPDEFFKQNKSSPINKILFLGRVAPIKDLETLIMAMKHVKKYKLEIVGPSEGDYINSLKSLVRKSKLSKKVTFSKPVFDIKKKIKKIDSAKIFILPSKTEAMPQSLIEAMARGKIVISSDNRGSTALIEDGKTGYLFPIGDSTTLAEKINKAKNTGKQARRFVQQFAWSKVIKKIEGLF